MALLPGGCGGRTMLLGGRAMAFVAMAFVLMPRAGSCVVLVAERCAGRVVLVSEGQAMRMVPVSERAAPGALLPLVGLPG